MAIEPSSINIVGFNFTLIHPPSIGSPAHRTSLAGITGPVNIVGNTRAFGVLRLRKIPAMFAAGFRSAVVMMTTCKELLDPAP